MSLATALILILVIGCALHVVNWRIHRDSAGVKWWALGLIVHTTGLTLSFWENSLAIHVPFWIAVGGLSWYAVIEDSVTMRGVIFAVTLQLANLLTLTRLYFIARRDGLASILVLASSLGSTIVLMSGLIAWHLLTQPDVGNFYDATPVMPGPAGTARTSRRAHGSAQSARLRTGNHPAVEINAQA